MEGGKKGRRKEGEVGRMWKEGGREGGREKGRGSKQAKMGGRGREEGRGGVGPRERRREVEGREGEGWRGLDNKGGREGWLLPAGQARAGGYWQAL